MILVVDDIPENVYSLQKVLEYNGFMVDTAFSGEEALKKILTKTYVLVILDVQMPGIDGFEVAENIKGFKKAKDTAVMFLSANSTDTDLIVKGYTQGAIDYITKPVDTTILLLKVKAVYEHYETRQHNKQQQQQVNDLYSKEKERSQHLSESIANLSELLGLAKIACWDYFSDTRDLHCTPEVYTLLDVDPNKRSIDLKFILANVKEDEREFLAKFKGKDKFQFIQEINGHCLKIVGKKKLNNDGTYSIKGLVQDISSFETSEEGLLSLILK